MKIAIYTLGCKVNQYETQAMETILRQRGHELVEFEEPADAYIVNTCTVTAVSDKKSRQMIRRARRRSPDAVVAVCGCYAQTSPEQLEKLEVDLIYGTGDRMRFLDDLEQAVHGKQRVNVDAVMRRREFEFLPAGGLEGRTRCMLKVEDGCVNFCTYCAIPLIRGGFRSREMEDVLDEIRTLAEKGVREHVLVAQDTSRFGIDRVGHSQLPELMERAAEIPGVEWLRVLYCYPDEIDEELLNAMARHPNICKYLDLPLQHADPLLLKRMNRRGDPEKTRQLLHRAREMGFTLRTTFIVGFPGETDEQFARLMDFVREIRFDRLGAFPYSPEENTPAARMDGQIPEELKQKRRDELMTAQQAISLERNRLRIGTEEKVLVETVDGKGHGVGRSAQEAPDTDGVIKLTGVSEADLGRFVPTRITGAEVYDMRAERVREDGCL